MQFRGPQIAQVHLQILPGLGTVDGKPHMAAVPRQLLGEPHADPVASPIGDQHARARIGLGGQHIPSFDDMALITTLDLRMIWRGAGRDDDCLGTKAVNKIRINSLIKPDLDAGFG